jgi:hypothetical protein
MKSSILGAVLFIIGIIVPFGDVQAASFDCNKAKTRIEKRICSDPALSKADEQLAIAYSETLKAFIVPEFIKDSQRSWLSTVPSCLTAGTGDNPDGQTCIGLYLSRIEALHLYATAKVYSNYGRNYSYDRVTMLVYRKDNALWLEWFGDWMPDAYKPKPFPNGFLAQDGGKLIPKGDRYGLEDRDDADISVSDDKISFGGEFGMMLTARQAPLKGDYARVK